MNRRKSSTLAEIISKLQNENSIQRQIQQQQLLVEYCTYFWLAAGRQFSKGFAINSGDLMAKFNEATCLFDFVYLITTRGGLVPMDDTTFLDHLLARRSGFSGVSKGPYKPPIEHGHDNERYSGIFSSLTNAQVIQAFRRAMAIYAEK